MNNQKLIKITKRLMLIGGLWNIHFTENTIVKKFYFFYSIFIRSNFVIFLIFIIMEIVRLILAHTGADIIFLNMAILINGSKIAVKILIYQKNKVPALYGHIMQEEEKIWLTKDEDLIKPYSQLIKYCRKLMFCQIFSTLAVVLSFFAVGTSTFIQTQKEYKLTNQTVDTPFLYQFWFPHKRDHIVVVYSINLWFGLLCSIYNSLTHMIFTNLMVFVAIQFRMLQVKLRKIDSIATKKYNGDVIGTFKRLIVEHQLLIEFTEHLNESTKSVMLMEFLLSSWDVASVAVQAITLKSPTDSIFLLFYFGLMVLQVFVMGWTANEIKVQSIAVADAVYDSKWHNCNKEVRQMLQIMLIRAQKPLTMTIGPFGPMTTETALMIMKAAYSYITIMKD